MSSFKQKQSVNKQNIIRSEKEKRKRISWKLLLHPAKHTNLFGGQKTKVCYVCPNSNFLKRGRVWSEFWGLVRICLELEEKRGKILHFLVWFE